MQNDEPRTIKLYGELAVKFGAIHKFVCHSTAEAMQAMGHMVPGFRQHLAESKQRNVEYAVFVGEENIGEDALDAPAGNEVIRIAPVIGGSGRGVQLIGGIVLAVVGAVTYNPYLISAGVGLAIGGAVQYLVQIPDGNTGTNSVDNGASYNFNGPVNVTAQGNPIPVLYGELITGSVTVSGDMYAENQQ